MRKNRDKVTHGMSKTKIFDIYYSIVQRCNDCNCKGYKNYGGRGIKNEWENFEEFYKDMYNSYLNHKKYNKETTIDRINVNLNYNKSNCTWATRKEQSSNKRNTIYYKGKCLKDYCTENGLNYKTIWQRYKRNNWTLDKAINTLVIKNK